MDNSYLIGPEGEMYKCWHYLGHADKVFASVFDKHKIINLDSYANSMLKNDCLFDDVCTSCVLYPSCSGGCADMRQEGINQCIPAKSKLNDFLEIHYLAKKNLNRLKENEKNID
jgi:uncharacterized protein